MKKEINKKNAHTNFVLGIFFYTIKLMLQLFIINVFQKQKINFHKKSV